MQEYRGITIPSIVTNKIPIYREMCGKGLGPSKHFEVLQTFDRKRLAMVKKDGYENHL